MSPQLEGGQGAPLSPDPCEALAARLQALDPVQALHHDPIRWHTIQNLWTQAQAAPAGLRRAVVSRLGAHLQALEDRLLVAAAPASAPVASRSSEPTSSPARAFSARSPGAPLSSLEPMRQTHARLKIRQQLQRSLSQPLQHAGPLHSERLVQQSLMRLSAWSEPYVHRFMSYLDALATLEDAQALTRTPATAPGGRARAKVKAKSTTKR